MKSLVKTMTTLIFDLSSKDYHGRKGVFSSSQLKDILVDPEIFYRKYITNEIEREELAAFDTGTYFHTAVLEPEKVDTECCVYHGVRRGEKWEEFKAANKDKVIITPGEYEKVKNLVAAVKGSTVAMEYLGKSKPEVSAFIDLLIVGGEILFQRKDKGFMRLGDHGWVPYYGEVQEFQLVKVKVRADALGDNYILDLKSTSGNAKDSFAMRTKVSSFNYDLSAAYYLDIFSAVTERLYVNFLWTFASKDMGNCKTYLASSDNIKIGRVKWKTAIIEIAKYEAQGWKFQDQLGILEPNNYEREWLNKGEDLL